MFAESFFGPWFVDQRLVFNCSLGVRGAAGPVKLHARQRPTLLRRAGGACPLLLTGASTDATSQYYSSFTLAQETQC
jgi:hypothetical protein